MWSQFYLRKSEESSLHMASSVFTWVLSNTITDAYKMTKSGALFLFVLNLN